MSYKYYMKRQNPVSAWILDDTLPFHDASGFGAEGDKVPSATAPLLSAPLVAGAINSKVFSSTRLARFACNLFKPGLEPRPFVLEAWIYPILKSTAPTTGPQQILSHDQIFDGLSINGTVVRFSTIYATSGEAYCEYDLQQYRAAHVVGIHTAEENQLWVNGEFVASVALTDEQLVDTYSVTDTAYLYSGYTTSSQNLAMNGVAFYTTLTAEQIAQNYVTGLAATEKDVVAEQYGGIEIGLYLDNADTFIDYSLDSKSDWESGLNGGVQYSSDRIVPTEFNGLSEAGDWRFSVPLDATGETSIYGVYAEWEGTGITVEHSLDGTNWSSVTNRRLCSLASGGYDPTGKELEFRVNFPGNIANDPAHLSRFRVVGIRTATLKNHTERPVTFTDASVPRHSRQFLEYRDDAGFWLAGSGSELTIGADPTDDPDDVLQTLELWVNRRSGGIALSHAEGTVYINGASAAGSTSLVIGEWSLIHYVFGSTVTDDITITGNARIGRAVIYPTSLTASEVESIYKYYTGRPVIQIIDSASVGVSEESVPVNIYDRDWSISSAG